MALRLTLLAALTIIGASVHAEPIWTLTTSVERAVAVAPELRAADAAVGMRQGELTQAGAWPNPTVAATVDNKLGQEDASGGYNATELSFNQPLPLRRLDRQRRMADANLDAAVAARRVEQLSLENRVAHSFLNLQLSEARLNLARDRLRQAEGYLENKTRSADGLVRYLSQAEKLRLNVVRAEAAQRVAAAEGEYSEALSQFRALLALPHRESPTLGALTLPAAPPPLAQLEARLSTHPSLRAAQREQDAVQAGIDVARSQRFADPVISVFRSRDYFNGGRQDINGVGVSVQVPLWNRNDGSVATARAAALRAEAQRRALERDADARLRLAQQHLGHLIEQAQDYMTQVLEPTERLLATTRKTFSVGHADLLTLIDADTTYFEARAHYIELLQAAQSEAADLRLAVGESVLDKTRIVP